MELFCIDHLLMVEILSHQDMLTIDFAFPTTPGGATGEVTGLEAALQVPPPESRFVSRGEEPSEIQMVPTA